MRKKFLNKVKKVTDKLKRIGYLHDGNEILGCYNYVRKSGLDVMGFKCLITDTDSDIEQKVEHGKDICYKVAEALNKWNIPSVPSTEFYINIKLNFIVEDDNR